MIRKGLTALLICFAVTAVPAAAAERPAEPLPAVADSANLRVHYTTDPASPHRIEPAQARRLLAAGEAAYAMIAGEWGYDIVRDGTLGGDARLDVYVAAVAPEGMVQPDQLQQRTSGFITIAPSRAGEPRTIAHELFHLAQYGLDRSETIWLREGTAEWAEHHITGDYANGLDAFLPAAPLACSDPACGGGYGAWRFFEYLTERHGPGIVKRIYEHGRDLGAGAQSLAAIDRALAERGSDLPAGFAGFAWTNMTGAYARPEVAAWRSSADLNMLVPPAGITRVGVIEVERLATKHVAITAPAASPCTPTTMSVNVSPDPGFAARPAYQLAGAGPAVPVPPGGAALTWNSCDGLSLLLAVPNTSAVVGPAGFRVQLRVPPPPPAPLPAEPLPAEPQPAEPQPQAEPAPAAPAPELSSGLRLPGGQTMASILRRGLRLRLDADRTATARVTVTVLADRRTRRRHRLKRTATSNVVVTGTRTVALRLRSRSTRRTPPRLRLKVRARMAAADGATRTHSMTVTVG